jgi:hypothetical protein
MNLFQQHKYLIVRNAISFELANFAFNYFLMKRDATEWMHKNNYVSEFTPGFGTWKDKQIPNTFSCYGDMFMETLMMKVLPVMKKHTNLDVVPTYSYTRAYKKGDILHRHKDRPSCEISTTLHLGGNPWTIYIDPTGSNNILSGRETTTVVKPNAPKGVPVDFNVGDMLIYSGCELEHWREPFEGSVCVQTFLHYNNANGQYAHTNRFDKRPMLGIPK